MLRRGKGRLRRIADTQSDPSQTEGSNVSVRGSTRLTGFWLSSRCQVQGSKGRCFLVSRETLGSTANRAVELERDPQPELNLPWRPERVDACADPDAIYIVPRGGGPVDLSCGSR